MLLLLAFLSTGAFASLTHLTERYSMWMMLGVSGVWAITLAAGRLAEGALDRRIALAAAGVAAAGMVAALFSAQPLYAVLYDSYAYMPLVVWYSVLAAFLLAAKLYLGREVRNGLVLVTCVAAYPLGAALYQAVSSSLSGQGLTVFGNSNYFVSVTIMLVPVAFGLARTAGSERARGVWRGYAAVIALIILLQQTLIGYIVVPVALLLSFAIDPQLIHERLSPPKWSRVTAGFLAALVVASLLFATLLPSAFASLGDNALERLGANAQARVELWRGAQRMALRRPVLGYGPGGYKLASIEYLDAWRLPETSTQEPLNVSPPSPHSVVWTAVVGMGVLGSLACVVLLWTWLVAARQQSDASPPARSLRSALVVGFLAYVVALLTVPLSPAQGLLPAVVAGLAVASAKPTRDGALARSQMARLAYVAAGAIALLLALVSLVAYSTFMSTHSEDVLASLGKIETAERLQPQDPFYRFRWYEYRFITIESESDARVIREQFDAEKGVLRSYAPGLVGLAQLSMNQAERDGRTDLSWERTMLSNARRLGGEFPTLVAEELHLAGLSGDSAQLERALAVAKEHQSTYALLDAYITQAESMLATGAK